MKLLVASILVLAALALTSEAQVPVPGTESPDCHDARIWHLQQAMRHSQASDQEYHLGAADAAYMLAEYGAGTCQNWMEDASLTIKDGQISREAAT